ncbi:MAG TPA: hypothetical protein VGP93_19930 [Polyangiaceae bacterium]|nr:hypothetical protein [Polyangiaceae bacterium]
MQFLASAPVRGGTLALAICCYACIDTRSDSGDPIAAGGSGGAESAVVVCPYTLPEGKPVCSCPDALNRQNCTADMGQPILDDAEWEDNGKGGVVPNGAPLGNFGGFWGHWQDSSSPDCLQPIDMSPSTQSWGNGFANPMLPEPNPFNTASEAAMSLKGAGCASAEFWAGGLPDPGCENVSAFQGFTFAALADTEMDVTVFVGQKDAPGHARHTMSVHLTNVWQAFTVEFCMLSNAASFNAANVNELGFTLSTSDFQIWVDDIVFY